MTASESLHTLGRWTTDRAIVTPDRVAIDDRGVVITYRELDERASRLAASFLSSGYGLGDRVATVTGNSADHVVVFFACAKAGLVLVPLSWRLAPRELADQLRQAQPAVLLVEDEFESLAAAAIELLDGVPPRASLGASGIERAMVAPARGDAGPVVVRAVVDDDALLIIFTSGTLARAKGVILTHANCFWTNLSLSRTAELTSADTVLAVLPQYHVGAWNVQPLLAWWMGATVVLERTFDPGRVLHLIAERRITTMMGVPANYLLLAEHDGFASADLSSLGHAIVGGAPMPERLLAIWHGRGVSLTQGYGLTEASPNVLCLPDEDARRRLGSAGKPYPHVEVAVADLQSGAHLAGPARGELLVRGPGVFAGYFRQPDETDSALRDGWLATGDLVERDADGYFRVVDRARDLYISGGENVAPAEVEAALLEHPDVIDAGVIGVPDDRWGEVGVAFIVPRHGSNVAESAVIDFCRDRLARFKVPRSVQVLDTIPRTSTGKVQRRSLLAHWQGEIADRGAR